MTKSIVITGASKRIGRATADALAERGWTVIGAARSAPQLFPGEFISADLADRDQTEALASGLAARGNVLGIVNNFGLAKHEMSRRGLRCAGTFFSQARVLQRGYTLLTQGERRSRVLPLKTNNASRRGPPRGATHTPRRDYFSSENHDHFLKLCLPGQSRRIGPGIEGRVTFAQLQSWPLTSSITRSPARFRRRPAYFCLRLVRLMGVDPRGRPAQNLSLRGWPFPGSYTILNNVLKPRSMCNC